MRFVIKAYSLTYNFNKCFKIIAENHRKKIQERI